MSEEVEPHIKERFDLQEYKGKGAYGIVWKAYDRQNKQVVALKKVFDAFQNSTDAQRTYREVVFLKQLSNHANIIKLLSVIRADNNRDLYLVFEYMETDLHKVIRAGLLNDLHISYILYQMLVALKYIHSGQLIHRDLKPANILINSDCHIKLADFGLARCLAESENNDQQPIMTEYVATRWYRAPEILLGSPFYTTAVDMWSVGCILGEIILGKALFAGTSTLDQIERVISLLSKPTSRDLDSINAPMGTQIVNQLECTKKFTFHQIFNKATEEQIDLLKKLLTYNPKKRLTADQALQHPLFAEFRGTEKEDTLLEPIGIPFNDNQKLKMQDYRDALYQGLIIKKKQPIRSKSRIEQRTDSQNKLVHTYQQFKLKNDKSKSFHLDEEMPTVHKSYTKQHLLEQVPTTSNQKLKLNESKENSREGTIIQLIAQAQYNFNKKMREKKKPAVSQHPMLVQKLQAKKPLQKRSGSNTRKSKTPELMNYQLTHSRSLSQNKAISRSSSKPKTRGSPYHSEGKVLISQPDANMSLSKSFYNFNNMFHQPLYTKILAKQKQYESLKK